MKVRWIVLAVSVLALVALSISFAFAGTTSAPATGSAGCTQMHNTPAMQQMHRQMPAAAQAECNQMQAQMGTMMSGQMGAGMMGSGGMMSGSLAGHHTGGMMGS